MMAYITLAFLIGNLSFFALLCFIDKSRFGPLVALAALAVTFCATDFTNLALNVVIFEALTFCMGWVTFFGCWVAVFSNVFTIPMIIVLYLMPYGRECVIIFVLVMTVIAAFRAWKKSQRKKKS